MVDCITYAFEWSVKLFVTEHKRAVTYEEETMTEYILDAQREDLLLSWW